MAATAPLMWSFRIIDGAIGRDGCTVGHGYSGHAAGRNNPKLAAVPDVGPIPPGRYAIGPAYDDPHLGPCVMHLDAMPGTDTFGRSLFRLHGNNAANDASRGCVIAGPDIRHAVAASHDTILEVIV